MRGLCCLFMALLAGCALEPGATTLSDGQDAPDSLSALLAGEHRGMEALRLESGASERLFPEWLADPSTWYLVDPRGWIMMSYDADVSYKDVTSDLKFLLKNSSG